MRLWPAKREAPAEIQRSNPLSWTEYQSYFNYLGTTYGLTGRSSMPGEPQEEIGADFASLIQGAYKANGIIFACVLARMKVFSEARFQFRRVVNGKPGDLFGTSALRKLERPWPNGTTSDLLARMEQDASLSGNFFGLDRGTKIRRLRPDWVTIIMGTSNPVERNEIKWDPDAEVIGYAYTPGGPGGGRDPQVFLVEEVAHYAPVPDPEASFRGMSWLESILQEIMADKAATSHKLRFFERGGTPNVLVEFDPTIVKTVTDFDKWRDAIVGQLGTLTDQHMALFLGAGAKGQVIGSNLEEIEFKVTQGAGETRIAAAAGVPPIIAGFSEGLQAATYSNYGQARRHFADGTLRYLWRQASGALEPIVDVPGGAELWYDDRDVAFLQEDRKDAADIQEVEARTIRTLADGGFKPESVVSAVMNTDWEQLEHTGLPSVQVQAPPANQNGSGDPDAVPAIAGKE